MRNNASIANTTALTNSSSCGQTAKRLGIRNLRGTSKWALGLSLSLSITVFLLETPRPVEDTFSVLWKSLDDAVRAIHERRPVSMSLEILYKNVEYLCAEKQANVLYSSLKQLCEEHIQVEVPKLTIYPFSKLNNLYSIKLKYSVLSLTQLKFFWIFTEINDQIEYLKLLNSHWQDHCSQMSMICQIFLPLDRGYVLNNPLILSIWDLSLDLFKQHIITNPVIQSRCVNGLLMLIERERNGELVDRGLVKNLLNMLYKLQVLPFSNFWQKNAVFVMIDKLLVISFKLFVWFWPLYCDYYRSKTTTL